MEEQSLDLLSFLCGMGLGTEYWMQQFRNVGITSVSEIESHENDTSIYSTLIAYSMSEDDERALHKIFKMAPLDEASDSTQQIQQAQNEVSTEFMNLHDINNLVQQSSSGLVLQGVLLTKNIKDQLKRRNSLIGIAKNMEWNFEASSNNSVKVCFSKLEGEVYKTAMGILGCSISLTPTLPIYGKICVPSFAIGEKKVSESETYASTLRYFTVRTASCILEINGLQISESAKFDLQSILSVLCNHKEINSHVIEACERFFQTYGSHINLGPIHFGGHILWECHNTSFSDQDYGSILKAQYGTISSFVGSSSNDKAEPCSASANLECSLMGGPSNAVSLSQWKSELEENIGSWIVVDRGRKFTAIWDVIKFNHEEEFGDIASVLKTVWENKTGLNANFSFLEDQNIDVAPVLNQMWQWGPADEMEDSEIQEKLEHLYNIKCSAKTSGEWETKYLSESLIQNFLLSIVHLPRQPKNIDQIRSLVCSLLEPNEPDQQLQQDFPIIKLISDWLHVTEMLKVQKFSEGCDFSQFNDFLLTILAEKKESHTQVSQEELALMVGKAIDGLKSHYKQTYEEVLIAILVYPHQSTHENVSTTVPLSLSDVEHLFDSFLKQQSLFYEYQSISALCLQSNLLILAIETVNQHDITNFLRCIGNFMQELQPPLEDHLAQCLTAYFDDLSIENLMISLHAFAVKQYSKMSAGKVVESEMSSSTKLSLPPTPDSSEYTVMESDIPVTLYSEGKALLEELGLLSCYEKKLKLSDALCVRPEIVQLSIEEGCCPNPKLLPYIVLQKLMSYDSLCRSDLMQKLIKIGDTQQVDFTDSESDDYSDSDDDNAVTEDEETTFQGINPIDCLIAVFLCSDDFLRHDLFSRLTKCQYAVPLVIPDPISKRLVLPLWALKSIIKDWVTRAVGDQGQQRSHSMISHAMPIVSFMRYGKHRKNGLSKSQIINKLISDEENGPFFHRDCHGGQHKRVLGEGLVDMSWYLPSGKQTDIFPNPIAFLNLHGDALEHYHQTKFVSEISSVCFIMLVDGNLEFRDHDKQVLKKIDSLQKGLLILNGTDEKPKALKKEFPNSNVINLQSKTKTEINAALCKRIRSKLEKKDTFNTIEELCQRKNYNFIIDEDDEGLRSIFRKVEEIKREITNFKEEQKTFKQIAVPLQGKDLWQSWAALDKELNRQSMRGSATIEDYSAKIDKEKNFIRKQQLKKVDHLSALMKSFIGTLIELGGAANYFLRNFFLQNLKDELNSLSRDCISEKQLIYQATRKELSEIPLELFENEKKKKLKQKLENLQEDIIESSFGLEHLLREVGQIYEAAFKDERYKDYCAQLCKTAAELLVDGYPLELMDGDATHVPLQWVQAVLSEVIKQIGDQKIFVLSVLGLQSTGKSTMLNTTFGLQFNVSAGRCTRGAFMQIISLDDHLKASTGCSYILIVDTEGLRAPELDPLKTQKHDNELATFVIGLANMTLINIYGEVPGDMDDILQTSVHAFLRMTKVRFHPSCQFVHQNAGVNIKGEVGRAKFTQKLNRFTMDAAREEQCEGQYESFSQVIKFDDQTDVHYFPGLWKGDPPMAPVNVGYSHQAQKLKSHVIQIIVNRACSTDDIKYKLGGLTFSSFSLKVKSLWENLLKEKFVFSFKNTLEITAYNSLETEYSKWDWKFQTAMLAWERKAYNEINSADLNCVEQMVGKKLEDLQEYIYNIHEGIKPEMEAFFNGKHSEVLIQWKASSELRLEKLARELSFHAEQYCEILLQNRKAISEFEKKLKETLEKIKLSVQENIQNLRSEQIQLQTNLEQKNLNKQQLTKLLSRDLFTVNKANRFKLFSIEDSVIEKIFAIKQANGGKLNEDGLKLILYDLLTIDQVKLILKNFLTLSEEELKHKFDKLWTEEMLKITRLHSKRKINVPKIVQTTLIKYTRAHGGRDTHLISELRDKGWKGWAKLNFFPFEPQEGHHYKKNTNLYKKAKNFVRSVFTGNDRFQVLVANITATVIQEAKEHVEQIPKTGTDFKSTFVQELLQLVDKRITHHADEVTECKLSFTPDYKHLLYLGICSWAIPKFEEMVKLFDDQNDPRLHLDKYHKEPLFIKYRSQYKQIEFEEAIAVTICAYLEAPLKVQVKETLGERIIDKMQAFGIYYIKNKMALKVKVLLELQKKDDFKYYVLYLRKVRECLVQHLQHYTIEFCEKKVKDSQFTHLQTTAREQVSHLVNVVNTTIMMINKEDIDLREWLLIFCQDSNLAGLGLKLKIDDLLEGYENSGNVNQDHLRKNIAQQLCHLEERVLKSFEDIHCKTEMQHWTKQPHELLKNLIGCSAQCPFCGEQCDLMEHDVKDQLHRTEVHRINCLAGWRERQSNVMVTGFCPSLVADKNRQFYKANDELHHYCKYSEVYPTWSIPSNLTTTATYWKWFISKYREELAREYNALPAVIPNPWKHLEWKDVKEDLQAVYNIKDVDVNM